MWGYTELLLVGFFVLLGLIATAFVFVAMRYDSKVRKARQPSVTWDPAPDKPVYPRVRDHAPPAAMLPPLAALPPLAKRPPPTPRPWPAKRPPPTPRPLTIKKKPAIEVIESYGLRDAENINPYVN